MLVDVIELRLGEHPRDRADVLATVPVRGEINVDRFWTHGNVDRAPVNADLRPMQLETLYSARMEYWKGLDIKLSGYRYKLTASIDDLRQRFDWKHWPSLAGVIEALGKDAEAARVPEDSLVTLEVARQIVPGSPDRFLATLFHALANITTKYDGMFPDPFDVTNESLAALANAALRLIGDDRLRATDVDAHYGDWTESRTGHRLSRIPYRDTEPDFEDTDAPDTP